MNYPTQLEVHVRTSISRGGIEYLSLETEEGHVRGDLGPNEQPYIAIADQIVKAYNLFPDITKMLMLSAEAMMKDIPNWKKEFPDAEETLKSGRAMLKTLKEPIPYDDE